MISVDEALTHLFGLVAPMPLESVALTEAAGRVLAAPVVARRDQPPFAASAMDGYAVRGADHGAARLDVVGAAPAGHAFSAAVAPGSAVRIFTGAPMPDGTDTVIIQEDTEAEDGAVRITEWPAVGAHVRPAGGDFRTGDRIAAPRLLGPADLALAAAKNAAELTVYRRPVVALLATGDELVMPGAAPEPDQIVASNAFGLKAMFEAAGAEARLLPIVRDSAASLRAGLALAEGADLIVTIGGASVGAHDVVAQEGAALGLKLSFYRVAVRPGKPLMAGHFGTTPLVGLPGNPVSAMVCGCIFVVPMIRAMLGLGEAPVPRRSLPLTQPLAANGPREHYMRGLTDGDGVRSLPQQDSSLLSVLSQADVLIVRPPGDPAQEVGAPVTVVAL